VRALLAAAAVVLLAALGAAIAWRYFGRPPPEPPYVPPPEPPRVFVAEEVKIPVRFTDITEAAGIHFIHHNGARGKKLLPETMGGGGAFFDFDRDGDQDLLFVNSAPWPGDEVSPPPTQAIYENDGKGRFQDATARLGLAVTFYGMGVAIGDYDGDGWDDVFFTAVGPNRLFRNREGKGFEETTAAAGFRDEGPNVWSTSAAFLDYDNDGKLDLFVCRYVEWSPEKDLALEFQIEGLKRAYGPPMSFEGVFCKLYRNVGGRFEDVSAAAGIEVRNPATRNPMAKALGVATGDLDGDGFCDIAVANDTVQNFLFHNQGNSTFQEVGLAAGLAFDAAGNTRGAMGIDWATLDPGGTQGIVVGNFANEITALYRSARPLVLPFTDDAIAAGIGNPSRKYMKFGVIFFDFDFDGRLDILEANGHLEEEIQTVQKEQTYAQPPQLFWNAGPSGRREFEALDAGAVGPDLFQPAVGRGSACADIDGDGDLDVVLVVNNGRARLLRNDGGNANHWIRLVLRGKPGNTNAFGARVEAEVGGRTLRAMARSGRSYLSQSEQVVTLGLGKSAHADAVRIFWPGEKAPRELGKVEAGRVVEVRQGEDRGAGPGGGR
jgi:hypothetical protein